MRAYSGSEKLDENSRLVEEIGTVCSETLVYKEFCSWSQESMDKVIDLPTELKPTTNETQLLGHRQLSESLRCDAIASIPLAMSNEEEVGVLVVAGPKALICGSRLPNFLRASAPRLATALSVVRRAEQNKLGRAIGGLSKRLSTMKGKIATTLVLATLGILWIPLPYRVRTTCKVESSGKKVCRRSFHRSSRAGLC